MRLSWLLSNGVMAVSGGILSIFFGSPAESTQRHSCNHLRITDADRAEARRGVAAWAAAGASGVPANMPPRKPPDYRQYPIAVRALIRRADVEGDHCRGDFGDDPETLRACNREYYLLLALERKGWCWGGGHSSYQEHWLKCAQNRDYRPGDLGPEPPYSKKDIAEVARMQREKGC